MKLESNIFLVKELPYDTFFDLIRRIRKAKSKYDLIDEYNGIIIISRRYNKWMLTLGIINDKEFNLVKNNYKILYFKFIVKEVI
jgi:hypothetical protein